MELAKIIAAVGQRKEASDVEELVAQLGGKIPLPSKREGYFSAKKYDVVLAWHWEILAPEFYPPKKEGRKDISYVTSLWFPSTGVDLTGLPAIFANISPQMAQSDWAALPGITVRHTRIGTTRYELPVSDLATLDVSFDEDGTMEPHWTISVRDHNRHAYVRSSARSHAFSPWNPSWPDDQADLPMGMFMAWCIDRDKIGKRHLENHAQLVQAVRERKMTGREFLYRVAYCDEVWSWDFSEAAQDFAHNYLHCLCNRNSSTPLLGRADRCGVDDDFMAVFTPHFKGRGLDAGDTWENYERFALFLDARYRDFELTQLETDLDPKLLKEVKSVYRKAQIQMNKLATPTSYLETASVNGVSVAPMHVMTPSDLTTRLVDLLGKLTTAPEVTEFIEELKLNIPSTAWNNYIDAPKLGFFIHLTKPWEHDRLGEVHAKDKAAHQRKKIKLVEEIRFTAEGYANVSNSTGNYLLCSAFKDGLPFGFRFDESLAEADQRLGEDDLDEHTWDTYDDDGSLTRRWEFEMLEPSLPESYLVIAEYEKHRLVSLRLVLK
jgi:hypothetical protein